MKTCNKCGNLDVEAHHDDYSKPLEVRWLCWLHHQLEHDNMNALVPFENNEEVL